jgi:hypothetical protein
MTCNDCLLLTLTIRPPLAHACASALALNSSSAGKKYPGTLDSDPITTSGPSRVAARKEMCGGKAVNQSFGVRFTVW